MTPEDFQKQYVDFLEMGASDARFNLATDPLMAILDEDKPWHTGREYCWEYLFHCGLAARELARTKPQRHVDFGSYLYFAALCSAWVPQFEFYDIRPVDIPLPNLSVGRADLTALQFPNDSIPSLSSLHTIEHIGLGRYGDKIDPQGDVKAARELVRVLAPGGNLIVVFPMCEMPRLNFNAHRIMSSDMICNLFRGLTFSKLTTMQGARIYEGMPPNPESDYAGMWVFTK